MRVRLTTDRVVGYGDLQRAGDVVDVSDKVGRALIEAGSAERAPSKRGGRRKEAAALSGGPENAMYQPARKRRPASRG